MLFLWTTPRDGGSNAGSARLMSSSLLVLLAGLVLTPPAMAYAVRDTIEDTVTSSAARAIAAPVRSAQAQPQVSPTPPPAPARPAATPASPPASANSPAASSNTSPADEPIGNVATLTGSATVTRNNQSAVALKLKDDIYLNDVLQTAASSTLGVTFIDETTFNLTANASITVDNYIYEDGGKKNSALFNITNGTVAFVASAVAKTGDMKIATPTATLGIRGTTGLVEVNGAAGGAHNIKLYPDPDGHVGAIDVRDRNGARLGTLTQGSSGFSLRPGAGGRITAAPLVISPQQAARDQGIVRQAHAAQAVGRRVVSEQRAIRRANPNRTNPRNAPGQQPGQQRQNNLQQRPGGPQQPGLPNRVGQPGQPPQPGTANRAAQPGQPPHEPPGAQRPNAPALHQGALPNRPPPPPRRPPPPKKPPKEKRR